MSHTLTGVMLLNYLISQDPDILVREPQLRMYSVGGRFSRNVILYSYLEAASENTSLGIEEDLAKVTTLIVYM